ncbi:MAG: class I SAM-dependent methyltransferase [Pirellulales bacterium]|nr:class I SAM-dependent methyltransferase [Pirellulales bacterium]
MDRSLIAKVKKHWGKQGEWQVGRGLHWTEHAAVQERINRKVSGDPRKNPFVFLIDFLQQRGVSLPVERCLTLGCGAGRLERGLHNHGFCRQHDAYDIADKSIEQARKAAKDENLSHIHYDVVDLNQIALPADTYDVVFGVMSVHHFTNLEHIFDEVRRSLKPGGLFFLNEFVGPTKFQWTDRQLDVMNALLKILPERYRMGKKRNLKTQIVRPTVAEMDAIDPSEAIRSGEILDVLSSRFRIVQKRDYGGTLLHLLLEGIAFNFDQARPEDVRILGMLFEVEDALLETGELPSDFTVVVAEP